MMRNFVTFEVSSPHHLKLMTFNKTYLDSILPKIGQLLNSGQFSIPYIFGGHDDNSNAP